MQAVTSRRSRKSEIKQARKRAAAVYRTPNRHFFFVDALNSAMFWRIQMISTQKNLLSCENKDRRKIYLKEFLEYRKAYRDRLEWAKQDRMIAQLPLR